MIVCSCNVLSDHKIPDVVTSAGSQSLIARQVYGCLGCRMQCGRCARAIKSILNEALADCAGGCAIIVGRPSHGKTPFTLKPAAPSIS
jgi:bacterioferritin-associated ferredoxin